MAAADIVIKGAREHNLRDIDLSLPRNQLICLTGVSGSGKSSLAFDTLYAEGQRRYVESLSSFARQFLGQMPKPDVDYIGGLSPSISISQKSSGQNPRSTVGTITEIYDYLRVLYARTGQGHCPKCRRPITAQTREQIIERINQLPEGTPFSVLAPLIRAQKGEYRDLFVDLMKQGFARARVDGRTVALTDESAPRSPDAAQHRSGDRSPDCRRLAGAIGRGGRVGAQNGAGEPDHRAVRGSRRGSRRLRRRPKDPNDERSRSRPTFQPKRCGRKPAAADDLQLSAHYACTHCGLSFEPPSPQLFSFNSPQGMCLGCDGLGELYSFDPTLLVPDGQLSFKDGCFELLGPWRDLGRWKRHIYQGVADTVERLGGLAKGTMLETPWSSLDPELANLWLWGTGDVHITFTWRSGTSGHKYGGVFEGILPSLLGQVPQFAEQDATAGSWKSTCRSCTARTATGRGSIRKLGR